MHLSALLLPVAASPSPAPEGTDSAATTGLAVAGIVVFGVLVALMFAWLNRVRRARRRPPPRDPSKPYAEP